MCPRCQGAGRFEMAGRVVVCRKCRGTGYLFK
jgi:DnaJ-class molecular chaperone